MSARIRRVRTDYHIAFQLPLGSGKVYCGAARGDVRKTIAVGTFGLNEPVCSTGRLWPIYIPSEFPGEEDDSWMAELVISPRLGLCWINAEGLEDAL